MISKNPAESQTSPLPAAQAGAAGTPLMSAQAPIEAASSGDGTTGTPGANDNKPPGIGDQDPLFQLLG